MLSAASMLASPSPITGMSTRAADLQETRLLEMADDEGIVAGALCFECIADGLRRAAKFGQRMEMSVGRVEAMHLEPRRRDRDMVEKSLQALDVRRLLDRMNKALIPDPGRRVGSAMAIPVWNDVENCCRIGTPRRAIAPAVAAAQSRNRGRRRAIAGGQRASPWRNGYSDR